jgi:hypothetical protein
MPTPWKYLLNLADPGWVHCVSRCVRRVYLTGDAWEHRRVWIGGSTSCICGSVTMNNELSFPAISDPKPMLEAILSCGQGHTTARDTYLILTGLFRSFFPSEACPKHAEVVGAYIGSLLVGFFDESQADILERAHQRWDGVNRCLKQATDLRKYQADPDAINYAILTLLEHLSSHAKGQSKKALKKAQSFLRDGPLARWIEEPVVLDFNEEGWSTSRPKEKK